MGFLEQFTKSTHNKDNNTVSDNRRREIEEEERIRLKTRQKENNKNSFNCFILVIAMVILFFVTITNVADENKKSPTTAPTATQTPNTNQPSIGDKAYLRLPDSNDKTQNILLATEKNYYDEVLKTLMANDSMGILELVNENKAFGVSVGTKVLVIDSAVGIRKVRILKGVDSVDDDKVGLSGWVAMEWVVRQ